MSGNHEDHGPKRSTKRGVAEEKVIKVIEERALLYPDEWDEPGERMVLSEYHKPGLEADGDVTEEEEFSDLESFNEFLKQRQSYKVLSVYHKDGAPYVEDSKKGGRKSAEGVKKASKKIQVVTSEEQEAERARDRATKRERKARSDRRRVKKESDTASAADQLERVINVRTVEYMAWAVAKVLIGRGVRFNIDREGLADMEVVIKGTTVVLNSRALVFEVPELAIWRIIYTYKGKIIIEMGKGVKGNLRIHKWRLLWLLLELWRERRRKERARRRLYEEQARI